MREVVAIVGQPGAGKTWLREQLRDTIPTHLAIDDYAGRAAERWPRLLADLKATDEPTVIEGVMAPRRLVFELKQRPTLVIRATCPHSERIKRLERRGDLRLAASFPDYPQLRDHLSIDTNRDGAHVAVIDAVERFLGGEHPERVRTWAHR